MTGSGRQYTPVHRFLRAVEIGFRRAMLGVLTRIASRSKEPAPDWNAGTVRVLFLRHDRIGDMIVSTGIIHAIAQSHPNVELDVLASPLNAAVIEHDPLVRRVVQFDRYKLSDYPRLLRYLRKARYDVVVDSMVFGHSLTTMLLMLATRAPHRVGTAKVNKPNVYTMLTTLAGEDAHHVEHLAQLAIPFGIPASDALALGIALTDEERERADAQWNSHAATRVQRVLVNISAGRAFRQWPDDRYIDVARYLGKQLPNATILVMYGPGDHARGDAICSATALACAQTPGVRDAFALVATADFVFTPDTSIAHATSAFRVPAVALFTSDHLIRWQLYQSPGETVARPGATLAVIPTDDAIAAIDRVLARTLLVVE